MSKEIMQQALTVLKAWDALIKYQYGGSSEAMTAMQNVAWHTVDVIKDIEAALAQPEHNHLSDAMRLYQAVDRLATQAGEDASETIDWLCGEHGGMYKLFEAYFSPKPLANQTVGSGSPIDSSTNIAGSSIDSSDSSTHSAGSSTHMNHASMKHLLNLIKNGWIESAQELIESALAQPEHPLDKKADNARELGLDYEPEQEPFKPDWVSYRQGVADGAAQPEQESGKCGCGANLYIDEDGKPCSKVFAQPEQESKPMYVMGNYAGEGKVVSASFGLPKGAFEFAPYTGSGEASKIKHSLEPQPEQEPVAWQFFDDGEWHYGTYLYDHRKNTEADGYPVRDLYTAPPKREWVGLTGDEINDFSAGCNLGNSVQGAIRKAEAKLKEKNGG